MDQREGGCGRALALLAVLLLGAAGDPSAMLAGLVGHSEADALRRLGPPTDRVTTVDGARLFYDTLDAGHVFGQSGQNTRAGGPDDFGLFPRRYSFTCKTEVVIADGVVRAFNRVGNDCH